MEQPRAVRTSLVVLGGCCAFSMGAFGYDLFLHAGTNLIANQLNLANPPGNTVSNLFDRRLPDYSWLYVYKEGRCGSPDTYYYCQQCDVAGAYDWYLGDGVTPTFANGTTLDPGDALVIYVEQPVGLSFTGTPNIPALPVDLSCGCGHYYFLSRQTNDIGTYENITGLPPQEGSQFQRWTGSNFSVFTFSAGAWSPSIPSADVGEALRILASPCFSNDCLTLTPPANMVFSSCTNVQVFYNPSVSNRCSNAVSVVCTPKSGSFFAPGTTRKVHCLAIDSGGNGAVGDFTVSVGPILEFSEAGDLITFAWYENAQLQQADSPAGPWMDIPGGDVPPIYVTTKDWPAKFYRLRCQ